VKVMQGSASPPVAAEALFASRLQSSTHPTPDEIRDAVDEVLRRLGVNGCADLLAQEYGDHPVEAQSRMCWALLETAA